MKHSAPGLADHQMLAARFVTGPHLLAPDKAADWMHARDRNMADIVRLAVARGMV